MKSILMTIIICIFFVSFISAQSSLPAGQSSLTNYYSIDEYGLTSPGAMKYGLYGYANPALLSTVNGPNIFFTWSSKSGNLNNLDNWGLFTAVPHFGFAAVNSKIPRANLTNYKISSAFGNESFSLGFSYAMNSGNVSAFNASNLITIGTLYRPNEYFSLGLIGNLPGSGRDEGIIDAAVRPLGDEFFSLFGDYSIKQNYYPQENKWSAGASFEALPGVRITGRYFNTKFLTVGVELSFGSFGVSSGAHFDNDGKNSFNTYGIRFGEYDRNVFHGMFKKENYLDLNLLGQLKYQRYKLFDNSNTLLNLIEAIDAAKNDNTIAGIAINTSGMQISYEGLWELRHELKKFKASGKHVVIFIDRAGIQDYTLASVADKIVMDPEGTITLEGFLFGRQYYKNLLDKLGIGFTDLRYFKYKSAFETFSRDKMSRADSIQYQDLVDNFYQTAKNEICSGRKINRAKFDDMVNNQTLFTADEALKAGLADTLGRWNAVKEIVNKLEGKNEGFVGAGSLEKFNLPNDNHWGEKPKIAVIYALGICAMDEGIDARKLVNDVNAAANNPDVKAVVLRVNSPGGDGLASDIIAEALIKCKEKKPVIISQGSVAASGGYWLSMYADTIVAAPMTLTGSIGVIGGWAYNKSFDSKIGVTTDFVKRGEHADLGFGFTVPFIGVTLPDRNLTPLEQQKAEQIITSYYKEFVAKVASGRKTTFSHIDSIGQGRVWSGEAGLKNGLVDVLGGLSDAINIAAVKAGIKIKSYKIIEYPKPGLINFNAFIPKPFGLETGTDSGLINTETEKIFEDLKFRFENNGKPLPMLPLEDMELVDPQ